MTDSSIAVLSTRDPGDPLACTAFHRILHAPRVDKTPSSQICCQIGLELALPADQRREVILSSLSSPSTYFGPQVPQLTYFESDWTSEELGSGAYGSSFDVGGLTRFGPRLREPVGPIQIGSSDVGLRHVDGARQVGAELAGAITGH